MQRNCIRKQKAVKVPPTMQASRFPPQKGCAMKTFIDRLYALPHEAWKGRRYIVILNGAAENDDTEFRILHDAFKEMADYLGVNFRYLGVGTTDCDAFEANRALISSFIEENF